MPIPEINPTSTALVREKLANDTSIGNQYLVALIDGMEGLLRDAQVIIGNIPPTNKAAKTWFESTVEIIGEVQ